MQQLLIENLREQLALLQNSDHKEDGGIARKAIATMTDILRTQGELSPDDLERLAEKVRILHEAVQNGFHDPRSTLGDVVLLMESTIQRLRDNM